MPNTAFRLYNSTLLAYFDNVMLAIAVDTSDANGRIIVKYPSAGTYYATATLSINDTIVYGRFGKQLVIAGNDIHRDSMILRRKTTIQQNGFSLNLKDTAGGNLNNAQVYVYGSASLAAANDPSMALYHLSSVPGGGATQYDIPSGYYYVNATLTLTSGAYRRIGKAINIPAVGIITDTMVLNYHP